MKRSCINKKPMLKKLGGLKNLWICFFYILFFAQTNFRFHLASIFDHFMSFLYRINGLDKLH